MTLLGIILGLLAAITQSISYLYSRAYSVKRHTQSTVPLLVISHTLMGAVSLVILPFLWRPTLASPGAYAWPLIATSSFYLVGQATFFFALKAADASRVSPLLALKIIMIAVLWIAFGPSDAPLTGTQWLAVALSAGAAFMFNYTGKTLPARAIAAMLVTILMYAIADLYIIKLVDALKPTPNAEPTLADSCLGACLCYTYCGVVSTLLLPTFGSRNRHDWSTAIPFSITWYASMFLFFTCLVWTGPVLGNITLATRGLFSILLGIVLARAGHHHIEQHAPASIIIRRAVAATLMVVAIALYSMESL